MKVQVHDSLDKFFDSLEFTTMAKVLRTVNLLETFGFGLREPHSKKIKDNLFELRIRGSQEVRIFYTFFDSQIILLHGFVKKSQKTPIKEVRVALKKLQGLDSI
ncbi:MAG TPA: type II toxin-antitoxin system RelE/ParE family toxin [Candidatus Wildermuthbacteria bacterium]|nr:type II toxin-antitoxin system RelE/ParE family toxin [Candidatus Wildermuthbacteria bacterium]